jgi:hypothetical protein
MRNTDRLVHDRHNGCCFYSTSGKAAGCPCWILTLQVNDQRKLGFKSCFFSNTGDRIHQEWIAWWLEQLTCIVSLTGNQTQDRRQDGAGVGPLHQKLDFGTTLGQKIPEPYRGFEPRNSCLFGNTGEQLH